MKVLEKKLPIVVCKGKAGACGSTLELEPGDVYQVWDSKEDGHTPGIQCLVCDHVMKLGREYAHLILWKTVIVNGNRISFSQKNVSVHQIRNAAGIPEDHKLIITDRHGVDRAVEEDAEFIIERGYVYHFYSHPKTSGCTLGNSTNGEFTPPPPNAQAVPCEYKTSISEIKGLGRSNVKVERSTMVEDLGKPMHRTSKVEEGLDKVSAKKNRKPSEAFSNAIEEKRS